MKIDGSRPSDGPPGATSYRNHQNLSIKNISNHQKALQVDADRLEHHSGSNSARFRPIRPFWTEPPDPKFQQPWVPL